MAYSVQSTYTNTNTTVSGLWYANLNSNLIETTSGSGYNITINASCCALGGGGSGGDPYNNLNGNPGKHSVYNTATISNIYNNGCLVGGGGGGAASYYNQSGLYDRLGYGGNGGAGGGGGSFSTFGNEDDPYYGGNGGGASGITYTPSGYLGTSLSGGGGGFSNNGSNAGGGNNPPSVFGKGGTGSIATTNNAIILGGKGGGNTPLDGANGANGGGGGGAGPGGGGGAGGGAGSIGTDGDDVSASGGGGSGGGNPYNGGTYKGGTGGYGIYNAGTITNLYNAQGLTSTTSDGISFGPLFYGGSGTTGITNYYINITSSTVYGQLYNTGVNAVSGLTTNFNIDPSSTISTSTSNLIFYNVLINVTPYSKKGTVTPTSNQVWQLIKKTVTFQGINYDAYDLLIMNKTGFISKTNNSTDLSLLLQGNISTTPIVTGFTTTQSPYNGQDLGSLFQPQSGGTLITKFITKKSPYTGQDLGSLLQNL